MLNSFSEKYGNRGYWIRNIKLEYDAIELKMCIYY